ncbi:MAG: DNA polymerase III subunit beta, partial [Gemmatimonadetes bacterium]
NQWSVIMNIQISQENLQKGIQTVQNVVSSKTALPILSNVLLEAVEGKLIFKATDLDISISTSVPAIVFEEGSITLPAKKFAEIIKELPAISVSLEVEQTQDHYGWVTLKSERGMFKIMGIRKDEFPNFPEVSPENQITLSAHMLKRMIQKTIYAVSSDDTRPALGGLLFEVLPDSVTTVATDGRRLSQYSATVSTSIANELQVIVPPKALHHLSHLLGSDDLMVEITFDENYIVFQLDETTIFSRLIEGPFPDYKQVIPADNDKLIVVNRHDFAASLRRVSILASQQTRQIKLALSPNLVEISVNTPEIGEAKEEIPAEYTGEPMEIGYNASFLLDVVRNMDSERIQLQFGEPDGAGIFVPLDTEEHETYMALCMPLRLLS